MSKFRKGQRVAAVKDLGGVLKESVPRGSVGTVVDDGGWGGDATVLFTVKGGLFGLLGDRQVEIRVSNDEVR